MNELIKLQPQTINGNAVETVSARELHAFLEVQTRFNDWIAARINEYGFIENQDFVSFTENPVKIQRGRPSKEYQISLDMAKELSMVERNEKGRDVRQYFITCEKLAKQASTASLSDQLKVAQIGLLNRVLDEFGDKISPQARETLLLVGSEKFLGINTGYRPPVAQQTYSASEIGERLGISGNKVGRLTKAHKLKTEEYGIWVLDQSAHSNKQVTSFRYFESVVPVLKALIQTAL